MKITKEWLKEKGSCKEGFEWFIQQKDTDSNIIIQNWINNKEHLDWANWLIVRTMDKEQYIKYAIYAAEQVLYIFENKYPNDNRPRKAIEAAKNALENNAADAAAYAAAYAARAAYAAAYAADAATYAADAAAYAARAAYAAAYAADAADAAYAAAYAAAVYAARAAAADAADARIDMQIKILNYGMSLLKEDNNDRI